MMEFTKVGTEAYAALWTGAILSFILPLVLAIVWKYWKKERFSTILIGAATFILFALILEKPIQNVLLFPTQMGLKGTGFSEFVNAHPLLLAIVLALFPGVFEETGRFVAFKTVLRNRKNRETGISHGIGHAGIEVIAILGFSYITYLTYASLINSGAFAAVVQQTAQIAPDQVGALNALAEEITKLKVTDVLPSFMERAFSILLHVGASMMVFYACRDKEKIWLYPLAILIHTISDLGAALYSLSVFELNVWAIEAYVGIIGILTFCGAFFLLYRKDPNRNETEEKDGAEIV